MGENQSQRNAEIFEPIAVIILFVKLSGSVGLVNLLPVSRAQYYSRRILAFATFQATEQNSQRTFIADGSCKYSAGSDEEPESDYRVFTNHSVSFSEVQLF